MATVRTRGLRCKPYQVAALPMLCAVLQQSAQWIVHAQHDSPGSASRDARVVPCTRFGEWQWFSCDVGSHMAAMTPRQIVMHLELVGLNRPHAALFIFVYGLLLLIVGGPFPLSLLAVCYCCYRCCC